MKINTLMETWLFGNATETGQCNKVNVDFNKGLWGLYYRNVVLFDQKTYDDRKIIDLQNILIKKLV